MKLLQFPLDCNSTNVFFCFGLQADYPNSKDWVLLLYNTKHSESNEECMPIEWNEGMKIQFFFEQVCRMNV